MSAEYNILLVPKCVVIKLACTLQTGQFPLLAMGGFHFKSDRPGAREGPGM